MPLAKGCGAVSVVTQHFCDGRYMGRNLSRITGELGTGLNDATHVVDMVVAPALDCSPGGGTHRGGMKIIVIDAFPGDAVEVRRIHRAAKGAGAGEPEVIYQHQQDVGGACWCPHLESLGWLGIAHVQFRIGRSGRFLEGQNRTVGPCRGRHAVCRNQQPHEHRADQCAEQHTWVTVLSVQ